MRKKPSKKAVKAAIRGSVPHGKLRNARIVLADSRSGNVGGFTDYERKTGIVKKIGAPEGDTAYESAVRGHETRHATFDSKADLQVEKQLTDEQWLALQFIDDCRNEQRELPKRHAGNVQGLKDYRRAALATALRDLKNMKVNRAQIGRRERYDTVEQRNRNIMFAARIFTMLNHYGRQLGQVGRWKGPERHLNELRDCIGAPAFSVLPIIRRLARSEDTRFTALGTLLAMMEKHDDLPEGPEGPKVPQIEIDEDGQLLPVCAGSGLEGHMRIVELLPRTTFTAKEKSPERRYAPTGPIMNPARFVAAIVGNDPNGLFSYIIKDKPGGTVVIDASGSMGADNEKLEALCKAVPQATVAYYSGEDCDGVGALYVYAKDGKRYNGKLPPHPGGNSVDLPALRWLMKHPKPWTFVSDLEFCGGVYGSEMVAHAIVGAAEARGEMKVCRSLEEAFEHFKAQWKRGWLTTHAEEARQFMEAEGVI